MSRARSLGPLLFAVVVLAVSSVPAKAGVLLERWVTTPSGSPDGMALGDVDGDGRLEIAMILRGGNYTSTGTSPGVGTFVLLNQNGTVRFQVQTGQELIGFPTFGDFDGDSFDEVAFCEVAAAGYCYVYDSTGTELFRVGPLYFPAMTNSGPVAADINNDGYDDLIVASSAGEVIAARGPSGTVAWEYDLYAAFTDYPFGHASVDDIDRDGTPELVMGGNMRGGLYVLNADTGTLQFSVPNLYTTYQNYFHGSGPLIVNLDADAQLEIVATMAGYPGPAALVAFESNGTVKWRTTVSTDTFQYASPSAADTDGNNTTEIFVQTFGGVVMTFNPTTGALVTQRALGANSWGSPAFMDNDFDGQMEILTSTLSGVYLLNSNLTEIDRYVQTSAGIFPPPIVGDTDADGELDVVTGAWFPRQVLTIRLPYTSAYSWSAFGGSAAHTGAVPASSPEILLGNDPAPAAMVILQAVHNATLVTSGTQRTRLQDARLDLDIAFRTYLRGDPHLAVDRLRQALAHLQQAATAGYNTTELQKRVAYTGMMMFEQYIDRTQALVGASNSSVVAARSTLATATSRYNSANYSGSISSSDSGAQTLRTFLDDGTYTVGSYCPAALGETYFAWECRLIAVRNAVQALRTTYPSSSALQNADNNLRSCIVWGPDIVFSQAYPFCQSADANLASFTTVSTTQLRRDLAFAIMRNTRLFIDDATVWFDDYDPSALTQAETYYTQGETAWNGSDFTTAHARFISAYGQARPCINGEDDSFGNDAIGLEGGGCDP